jgi:O-acetyl-ADP-ribose deacetylase (regulator of RNase III)
MTSRVSREVGNGTISLVMADITTLHVDAMVNAANTRLRGGGGVDGAIHRVAGSALLDELREKFQHCPTGSAVITAAGDLPAKHVIHAVGPMWSGGNRGEPSLLQGAYTTAFRLASEHHLCTVATASISTGIYGFPVELAAPIALRAGRQALQERGTSLVEITWSLFNQPTYDAFMSALDGT